MNNFITEIESDTANNWLRQGENTITELGEENTYYIDEWDRRYFCKNYPQAPLSIIDALAALIHRCEAEEVGSSWAILTDAKEALGSVYRADKRLGT